MHLPAGDSELVQIVDAALADAARRAGPWLVCRPGCTQCCYGAFTINALDSARLHAGMDTLRASAPSTAQAIEDRARSWLDEHGADFPGDPATGRLGASAADRARFDDFANQAPCPALDPFTGRCDVYAWRPMTCRIFGPPVRAAGPHGEEALGHCELCFVGATPAQVAACEMPVPEELEAALLAEIGAQTSGPLVAETAASPAAQAETVVAFALLR